MCVLLTRFEKISSKEARKCDSLYKVNVVKISFDLSSKTFFPEMLPQI